MSTTNSVNDLLKIFVINKKAELKQHCRSIVVEKADFARFIWACEAGALPWQHMIHHRQLVPDHLILSDQDLAALSANGVGPMNSAAQKTLNKIAQTFEDRRLLVGHLFYRMHPASWHFFYFDQRDLAAKSNHWEGGSHIHLINHLWPNYGPFDLWKTFTTGSPKLSGAIHIRFNERSRPTTPP